MICEKNQLCKTKPCAYLPDKGCIEEGFFFIYEQVGCNPNKRRENDNMKEYFITKLSFRDNEKIIRNVFAYEYDGITLSNAETRQRPWLVNRANEGSKISVLKRNYEGMWSRGNQFTYNNNLFSWPETIPENIAKHKTFVSFYHKDDQIYRERFENLFGDLFVSKSVDDGDIDSDTSDEYIKKLIQKDYLS